MTDAASGFYVFPSDKPETSGVNLMKAQAMGAIPVTSVCARDGPNPSRSRVREQLRKQCATPEGGVYMQGGAALQFGSATQTLQCPRSAARCAAAHPTRRHRANGCSSVTLH